MTHSTMTSAAMVSTMGTARGTTHGSCRPFASSTPDDPSYRAVGCSCEIVAGGLKPILKESAVHLHQSPGGSCTPEVDIFPIRDPTLYPTTPVCRRPQLAIRTMDEWVIVLASRELSASEARPDLERLCGWDREHGVCKNGFELVETWLAETEWTATDNAGDGAAQGVVAGFGGANRLIESISRIPLHETSSSPLPFSRSSLCGDTA